MLPVDVKVISVDDRLIEHPRVWLDRMPSRLHDRVPRIVRAPGKRDTWIYEGRSCPFGIGQRGRGERGAGWYDVADRIGNMDTAGVWAQACYPTFGALFCRGRDKSLATMCIRAYNDFVLDEWCGGAPERQIPLAMVPFWDIAASVAEAERAIAKGAKSITFTAAPHRIGLPSWHSGHWDPLLAVCNDAKIPLSLNVGSAKTSPNRSPYCGGRIGTAARCLNSMLTVADLLMSPVFYKFPNLRVALSEGGVGWIANLLECADSTWVRRKCSCEAAVEEKRPSELFREHIYGCFVWDQDSIALRHEVGIDNVMFQGAVPAGEVPYSDAERPQAREVLAAVLAGIPDGEAMKIAETNARQFYDFWP